MSEFKLPLDFFDKSRKNAVADAGFMPGGALPPQKAHCRIEGGEVRTSSGEVVGGGPNIGLNFRVRVLQGERSKGGSFFWTYWTRPKEDPSKQQKITDFLFGLASDAGVKPELPPKTDMPTLKTYVESFIGKEFVGGISVDTSTNQETGEREVRGNRITGHEKATPEAIKKITAAYQRRQGTVRPRSSGSDPFGAAKATINIGS